jgi:hypothetical protein
LEQELLEDQWLQEAVLMQLPSGRTRYLVEVKQFPCEHCTSGTRVVSVWLSTQGNGEAVAWCSHCFNATCSRVSLNEDRRRRLARIQSAIDAGRISPTWKAARPALDDLRQRGLL